MRDIINSKEKGGEKGEQQLVNRAYYQNTNASDIHR